MIEASGAALRYRYAPVGQRSSPAIDARAPEAAASLPLADGSQQRTRLLIKLPARRPRVGESWCRDPRAEPRGAGGEGD